MRGLHAALEVEKLIERIGQAVEFERKAGSSSPLSFPHDIDITKFGGLGKAERLGWNWKWQTLRT